MELNAETVKKALECLTGEEVMFCRECAYNGVGAFSCKKELAKDALSLIKSQEQEIFELENRLKECENGYEGTLHLDRCKLHDAEEKIKELTKNVERVTKQCGEIIVECDERDAERLKQVAKLTEENERLRADKDYWKNRTKESESEYDQAVKRGYNLGTVDSVRSFAERLDKHFCHDPAFLGVEQRLIMDVIDQVAKEMLEGE